MENFEEIMKESVEELKKELGEIKKMLKENSERIAEEKEEVELTRKKERLAEILAERDREELRVRAKEKNIVVKKGVKYDKSLKMKSWITNELGITEEEFSIEKRGEEVRIVKFQSVELKEKLLIKRKEIRDKGLFSVDEDLTEKELKSRFKMVNEARKMREKGERVVVGNRHMFVGDKVFKWDENCGLYESCVGEKNKVDREDDW